MTTYTVTARANSNGRIYEYIIKKEGKGFNLYHPALSYKVPLNFTPSTLKSHIRAIECDHEIISISKS